jgi:hypothetical protein
VQAFGQKTHWLSQLLAAAGQFGVATLRQRIVANFRTFIVDFGTSAGLLCQRRERWDKNQKRDVSSGEANVFKRIMLTLSFVAAFSAAGLCLTEHAGARWWRSNEPYVSYYHGPSAYYGYDVPYRRYDRGYYYAPRPYYDGYYDSYYGNSDYYYYRPEPRVSVRVGPVWR